MKQILINYLIIFIIPFLVGALIRLIFSLWSRGWTVTVACTVLYLVTLAIKYIVPDRGSELYGLLNWMAASALAGALLVGVLLWLRRRKKKKEQKKESAE